MSMMEAFETGKSYKQHKKKDTITWDIKEVEIYPEDKTIEAMTRRAIILNEAFTTGKLPPIPDKETRKWLCSSKYCSTTSVCPYYESLEVEDA